MFEHLLHTNMRYFCPYLCYIRKCNMADMVTHKNMISKCVCTFFFLHMKMCNVLFSFTFFQNLDRCISKYSQSWKGQIHLFLRF